MLAGRHHDRARPRAPKLQNDGRELDRLGSSADDDGSASRDAGSPLMRDSAGVTTPLASRPASGMTRPATAPSTPQMSIIGFAPNESSANARWRTRTPPGRPWRPRHGNVQLKSSVLRQVGSQASTSIPASARARLRAQRVTRAGRRHPACTRAQDTRRGPAAQSAWIPVALARTSAIHPGGLGIIDVASRAADPRGP